LRFNKRQLSSGYINIFDKLVDAYGRIADAMPHIDRLESAFNDDARFRMVLAMVYADIVEFHRRAYKFFRRRGEPNSQILIRGSL
jgi:hypothetical protein